MHREIISESDLPVFGSEGDVPADETSSGSGENGVRATIHRDETGKGSKKLKADSYSIRLIKYIPSEVIALYLTLEGVLKSANLINSMLHWAIFAFGIIGTFLYLWRVQQVSKKIQLVLSILSFCVWVFAFGGPFASLFWYKPLYGALLLPSFTFIIPIINAKRKRVVKK
jgi:hypothetical protein